MASKCNFSLIFLIEVVLVSGSIDSNYGDPESTSCTEVLIREYGPQVNYRIDYIRLVSECPKDYNLNSTVRKKCETEAAHVSILEDIFLFTMALDINTKSIIYLNAYCAICNGQKEFYQFPPHFYYQLDEANVSTSESMDIEINKKYYPISEHTSVLSNLRTNGENNELVSFNEAGLKFKFKPYKVLIVPKRSKKVLKEPMQPFRPPRIPFCPESPRRNFECVGSNSSKIDDCYYHDDRYSNIFNSQVAIDSLNRRPGRPANATFCPEKYIDCGDESSSCRYEDENGYECWWNKFLTRGVDYTEGENGEIFFVDNYTMMNISRDEYSIETGLKNVVYLCGVDQGKDHENQYCIEIMNSIQCLLRRVSLFCVVVYLSINGRHRILSDLVEKITYSYYATLLLMYLREEISEGKEKKSCFLEYTAYRYLLQSYTFWIIIATCYLWIIIRSPGSERAFNENISKRRKIYFAMCLIGWGLPAVFLFIFYLSEEVLSCPVIHGYINLKTCKSPDEPDAHFWFVLVSICIICAIVLVQFLAACYYYQFGKSGQIDGEIGCSDWRTRMIFFFKIVYSIGLYLMLLIASMVDHKGPAYGILLHLWSFHGTLIFFLYSFKVTVLKKMFTRRESPEGAIDTVISAGRGCN